MIKFEDFDVIAGHINIWREKDGWRSWEYNEELNRYIFDDVPRENMLR